MAENFDKQVRDNPLCALAEELGVYHFKGNVRSQESVAKTLKMIANLIGNKKDKLTEEQAKVYEQAFAELQAKPQKQTSKQPKAQEEKAPEAQVKADITPAEENNTPSTEKKGENKMAEEDKKDFNKLLQEKEIYLTAAALTDPKIDLSVYTANDEDSLNKAIDAIKAVIKGRSQDEQQCQKDLKDLEDKPELKKEYQKIEEEGKPRQTMEVNQKEGEAEVPADVLSWIEAKKKFWAEFAAKNTLAADFNIPEGDGAKVYCALSKDNKQEGIVSYSSPNSAQVSKDSGFKIYQGLVEDAVKNELSITMGKSLGEAQKLMLYAAVLASDAKYQSGEKPQLLGELPVLSADLIKSDTFKNLPEEARNVLLAEAKRQEIAKKLETVRGIIKKDDKDNNLSMENRQELRKAQYSLMGAQLSPEDRTKKEAQKLERDKIMAARLGIIPEYALKDSDGKVLRTVQEDENLIKDGKLNESRVSKEQFDALMARKKELEGK